MIEVLKNGVTPEQVGIWLLIAFLVGFFIYKEWPDFRKRVSSKAVKQQKDEIQDMTIEKRLADIETEVKQVNEKLNRDYGRLNRIEVQLDKHRTQQASVREELEIIMRALIGVLQGLQEQGANGPTKTAENEIQDYLNKKAHQAD